jgi:D-amino-acid dehydrogenase
LPDDVTTGDEARLLDDALSPGVRAAYLVEGEGVVDPEAFALGLGRALTAAGVKVHENAEALGFRTAGGQVTAVRTDLGEIPCRSVVIAAGMRSSGLLGALGHPLPLQAGKGYSFSVDLDPAPRHTLYFGERRAVASPIGGTTRIAGTMEPSGNNNRLDWRRVVAVAMASRHCLGRWFDDPDDLVSLIRDPWVGGRPFLPDGLPLIDRLPGHDNAFAATGHGMLGVTLGPATGHRLAEHISTGRRPEILTPFGFDRLRR